MDNTVKSAPAEQSAGFAFVQELAASLSAGPIRLPSFPDVALRVQQVLADDSVSTQMVVRVVGAEPMLAARVVSLANTVSGAMLADAANELATLHAALGR